MTEAQHLSSAAAAHRVEPPSSRDFARSLRDNAIGIFPPQAFEEDVVFRRVFGRRQIIMSRAVGIQRILVDNSANYRRTAAGIRILRPLLGKGLLLSRGEDWRQQRRTLAPAFARARYRSWRATSRAPPMPPSPTSTTRTLPRSTSWRRCSSSRWRSPAPRCSRSRSNATAPSCAG
jgi:cytochrome P450